MKKILAHWNHRRRHKALLLYVDDELPPFEKEEMRQHLANCAFCNKALAELHACRAVLQAGETAPLAPTDRMWQRLVRTTAAASLKPRRLNVNALSAFMPLRWAAVGAFALVVGLLTWRNANEIKHKNPAEQTQLAAVIDYGMFFDAMRRETSASNFYQRYPAQVVQLAEAQRAVDFPLAAVEALPDSFQLDCVRVLECNGAKCIQLTCLKDGKVLNIFQHELGQSWTLGQYAVVRAPICNVECLLVNAKELTAVSWQGSHSEYLAVGQLPPQDFAQIVQILR